MTVDRPTRVGLALVAVYVVAAVATAAIGGHRFRPLFDGGFPPAPYRWVKPPPELASGNQAPTPGSGTVPFSGASQPMIVATGDGQANFNLPQGAFAAHPTDTSVSVSVVPLDPATLGPLPAGYAADGNAYRVTMTYEPSKAPVEHLAVAGNIVLISATRTADSMATSVDGRTWRLLQAFPAGGTNVAAALDAPGYFVDARSPNAPRATTTTSSAVRVKSRGGSGFPIGEVVAAAAAAVVAVVALLLARRSRRQRRERAQRRRAPSRGRRR